MADTNIVRILINVETIPNRQKWQVQFATPDHSGWEKTRQLLKVQVGPHHFPRPDPDTVADLPAADAPHYTLCIGDDVKPLHDIYYRIVNRSPRPQNKDVSTFGRYLFDTLIGADIWQEITQLAAANADVLELALAWDAAENDLHRLNWEMMHDPNHFVAAKSPHPPHEVAITRVVKGANFQPRQVTGVPRCLFVIGAELTDRRIRPGAEYLGLLRQIERAGRTIHTHVLRRASPQCLQQHVKEFEPDIVHFICHGEFDGRGNAYLELALDATEKEEENKKRDANAIHAFLSAGQRLPTMVVLSACNTGQSGIVEMKGAHDTAPMAAALVDLGIPTVIGMAGRVADSACRHFTRRFAEAIVKGEPLVKAAADGRRAAFAYEQSPEESVDWAFPAVFMAEAVPADYTPASPIQDPNAPPVETWVSNYNVRRQPAFCGRLEFYDAYYELFEANKPSVLAAYVIPIERQEDHGFGKSRLLQELTAQAIRDGHIPVPLIHPDNPTLPHPENMQQLRKAIIDVLNHVTYVYGLDGDEWQLYFLEAPNDTGEINLNQPDLDKPIRLELRNNQARISPRALQLALQKDLGTLVSQARNKHAFIRENEGKAILLLDDVQRFGEAFLSGWFGGKTLGEFGLGSNQNNLIPVVMTLSLAGAASEIIRPIREKPLSYPWLSLLPLQPFPAEHDLDLLAYERIMLHPFDGTLVENISDQPFAINSDLQVRDQALWNRWRDRFRQRIGGIPIKCTEVLFYTLVEWACEENFLLEANDEVRLDRYMTGNHGQDS